MPLPGEERRSYKRHNLDCPVAILDRGGRAVARGRTVNLSDGGALVSIPTSYAPEVSTNVKVLFSVPRATPNTYMLEEFASPACVVRRQGLVDESAEGVAVRFTRPLNLALEI